MTSAPLETLTGAALGALWASVAYACAFAFLVCAANALVRPTAATRHLLWSLVIVIALAVPLASFTASLVRARTISAPPAAAAAAVKTIASVRVVAHFPAAVTRRGHSRAQTPDALDRIVGSSTICAALLTLWLAIAFYKNVALIFGLLALRRVKLRATPLSAAIVEKLAAWRANATGPRSAVLAVSEDIGVPCAAGIWSPAILLPASVVAYAPIADIDRIAMHEFAHLRRFDDWTNVVERLAGAALWFNPAIALAKRRIAIDREIACDDWVVARTGGAHGYAQCLFRLAEATHGSAAPVHALGALGNTSNIAARIEHLVTRTEAPRRFSRTLPIALSLAAGALIVGGAMNAPAIAIEVASPAPPVVAASATPTALATALATGEAPPVTSAASAGPTPATVPTTAPTHHAYREIRHAIVVERGNAKQKVILITPLAKVAPIAAHAKLPPLPRVAPLPPLPEVRILAGDESLDAAAERLSQAALDVAQRQIERAMRSRNGESVQPGDAELRAASERMRTAERSIRAAAKALASADMRAQISDARQQASAEVRAERWRTSAEQIRATLEMVRQTESVRKEAIAHALESVRAELERARRER